jgi:hypothetical protein
LIDTRTDSRDLEKGLVVDGYLKDPDFDRWYPLSAVLSLVTTPPPAPLEQLTTPTMFVVASEGPTPDYIVDLYQRLPAIPKRHPGRWQRLLDALPPAAGNSPHS